MIRSSITFTCSRWRVFFNEFRFQLALFRYQTLNQIGPGHKAVFRVLGLEFIDQQLVFPASLEFCLNLIDALQVRIERIALAGLP